MRRDEERIVARALEKVGLRISATARERELPPHLAAPPSLDAIAETADVDSSSGARSQAGERLSHALEDALREDLTLSPELRSKLRALLGRRRGLPRAPRWLAAAALLLLLSAIGTAAGVILNRGTTLVATSDAVRVGELTGPPLDFRAAGVTDLHAVRGKARFVWPGGGGTGTVAAVSLPRGRGLDFCAFGPDGQPAWRTSAIAPWWSELLAKPKLQVQKLKSLVTRSSTAGPEESICAVIYAAGQSLVLVLDPVTGAKRGHFLFYGVLAAGPSGREVVAPLPAETEQERSLIVLGSHAHGHLAEPCALVFRLDGTVVQQVRFPTIGYLPVGLDRAFAMTSFWAGSSSEVVIETADGVQFAILTRDGRLELQTTFAAFNDNVPAEFEKLERVSGGWPGYLAEQGGRDAYRKALAAAVRTAGTKGVSKRWRGG